MFDLTSFSLGDMYRCSAALRRVRDIARDEDDAAERVVDYLFQELASSETRQRQCALVRIFRTRPFSSSVAVGLGPSNGVPLPPSAPCLVLWATRGIEPQWNRPDESRRHRLFPLDSKGAGASFPMVAALLEQLRLPAGLVSGKELGRTEVSRLFDVFHVEEAEGSPLVPDQAGFVDRYGVRSALGFGGVLSPSSIFVVVLFSTVRIPKETAELFRTLAPSVGVGLLRHERGEHARWCTRAYEQIVHHHEAIALECLAERRRADDERDRLLEEARAAKTEAQLASRAKDDFLALLGHELRNPLSPILTALELMKLRGESSRELQVIERQSVHLARLVDDLLDVSRIARGEMEVHREPIELDVAVEQAVQMTRPVIEQRSQRLVLSRPPEELWVDADLVRLAQVFANLLDNASKYSPIGSTIDVRVEHEDSVVRLRVRDEGKGIPETMLTRIFESFVQYRERGQIRASFTGLGLGLTIVRSLVELHGGSVRAYSAGPGKGSEFVVELPLLARVATSAALASPETVCASAPRIGKRILLVDDNEDAACLLAEALREGGHDVLVANDGPAALAVAESFNPDVALLDIGLPEMNGYELARRLRLLPKLSKNVRFVAVTGYGQDSDRRRSADAGFVAHLVKPITLDRLMEIVSAA